MTINETEHFSLTNIVSFDTNGREIPLPETAGLKIQIKNVDNNVENLLFILYKTGGCYIETVGSKLQNYITSWELFEELVKLIDEGFDRVSSANALDNFFKIEGVII